MRESVSFHPIAISRKMSPMMSFRGLGQRLNRLLRLRPDVVNVSTPKVGLLGGLAACITRLRCRMQVVRGACGLNAPYAPSRRFCG